MVHSDNDVLCFNNCWLLLTRCLTNTLHLLNKFDEIHYYATFIKLIGEDFLSFVNIKSLDYTHFEISQLQLLTTQLCKWNNKNGIVNYNSHFKAV